MDSSDKPRLSGSDVFTEEDERFMNEAFNEARLALNRGEVPIGCVFVKNGKIVARGGNETNEYCDATRHAEIVALERFDYQNEPDLDLYVTIEPCIMCAEALLIAKVRRVVYGAPNDKFGGCGSVLAVNDPQTFPKDTERRGFPCLSGLGSSEAVELLRQFYMRSNEKAPHPRPDGMAARTAKRLSNAEKESLKKVNTEADS